jgi:hypothetical protein
MNKKVYVGIYAVSLIVGMLSLIVGLGTLIGINSVHYTTYDKLLPFAQIIIGLAGLGFFIFLVVYMIYCWVIPYKMWQSINDGQSFTTPGKAVGFLFIPFFNIYWIFKVWGGFPGEYNNFIARQRLSAPALSSPLYTIFPIMVLLSGAGITLIINFFVLLGITRKTCDAVNAISDGLRSRQNPAGQPPFQQFRQF